MNLTSTTDDIMEAGRVATTHPFTSDSLPMDALPMVGTGSPRLTASSGSKQRFPAMILPVYSP